MLEPLWNALHRWTAPKSAAPPTKEPDGWDIPPTSEKAAAGPRGITLPWLPPYFDEQQTWGESAAMRLAYRRMLASPEVKSAFLGKALAVCALDLKVHHYGKKKGRSQRSKLADQELLRHQEIAEFVRWNLEERVSGGWAMVAWSILAGALVDGYSVNEKVWAREDQGEYTGAYVLDALKPKDTGKDVVLKTDEFRNVTSIMGLRFNGGQEFDPGAFLIFRHLPFWDMPTGWSDLRSAYASWHMIVTVKHLRAMGLDKRSLPMLVGHYTTQEQKVALNQTMALVRSQNWFAIPEGARLEALNIAGMADAQFADAIKDLKHDVFLSIQGAILQALEGSTTDGRGNSQVHRSTADLFVWYLSSALAAVLNDRRHGLIPDLVSMNFEGVQGYPRASLSAVDVDELTKSLQVDTGLRQLGCDLSKDETYERYGRTPPEEPEDVLPGQQPPPGAGGGTTPGPGGNGQPQHPGGIIQTASGRHIRYEGGKRVPLAGFGEEDCYDFSEVFLSDAPPDFYGAEEDWFPGQGPRGGTFWVHNKSGRKVYSKTNPGAGSGHGAPHPAEAERGQKKEEMASKKDVLGRDRGPRAATGEAREASRTRVKELLASKEKLTGAHVDELHGHLMELSVKEIQQLKSEGGVKASGRKHELAQKVADRLIGKLRGAQQTQRASELHGELASLAGQAKAPGVDPHVAREVGRLKKALDKVHNGEVPQERASAALEQIGKELAYVKDRLGEPTAPVKGKPPEDEFRAPERKLIEAALARGKATGQPNVKVLSRKQVENLVTSHNQSLNQNRHTMAEVDHGGLSTQYTGLPVSLVKQGDVYLAIDNRSKEPAKPAAPTPSRSAPAPQNDQEATPQTRDAVRKRLEGLLVAAKPALRAAGKQDVLDALIDHGKHVVASIGAKGTTNKAINRAVAAFEGAVARRTEGLAGVKEEKPKEEGAKGSAIERIDHGAPRWDRKQVQYRAGGKDFDTRREAEEHVKGQRQKEQAEKQAAETGQQKQQQLDQRFQQVKQAGAVSVASMVADLKQKFRAAGLDVKVRPAGVGGVTLSGPDADSPQAKTIHDESFTRHEKQFQAAIAQPPSPGFTGTDALGREWRNGELVAAKEEAGVKEGGAKEEPGKNISADPQQALEQLASLSGLPAPTGPIKVGVEKAGGGSAVPGEIRVPQHVHSAWQTASGKNPADWSRDETSAVKTVLHEMGHNLGSKEPGWKDAQEKRQYEQTTRPVPSSEDSSRTVQAGVGLFLEEATNEVLAREAVAKLRGQPWNYKKDSGAYQQYVLGVEALAGADGVSPEDYARKLRQQTMRDRLVTVGRTLGAKDEADALARGQRFTTEVLAQGNDFPVRQKSFDGLVKQAREGSAPTSAPAKQSPERAVAQQPAPAAPAQGSSQPGRPAERPRRPQQGPTPEPGQGATRPPESSAARSEPTAELAKVPTPTPQPSPSPAAQEKARQENKVRVARQGPPPPPKPVQSRPAAPGMKASVLPGSEQFKPLKDHNEQHDHLSKLGVKTSMLSRDARAVEESNRVCQVMTAMKALGFPMPDVAIVSKSWFEQNGLGQALGVGGPITVDGDRVTIVGVNYANPYNGSSAGLRQQWSNGHTSTSDVLHPAVHEFGHHLHAALVPGKYNNPGNEQTFQKGMANLSDDEARQVSGYGRTQAGEFVAETFAGMILGNNYSPNVIRLYRELGGAMPPKTHYPHVWEGQE